jgi:hypothetical protein
MKDVQANSFVNTMMYNPMLCSPMSPMWNMNMMSQIALMNQMSNANMMGQMA